MKLYKVSLEKYKTTVPWCHFRVAPMPRCGSHARMHAVTRDPNVAYRLVALLWCGVSAFSPLAAGRSTLSIAGTMWCLTAPQHPLTLNSQPMSSFPTTPTEAGGYHGMHVPGA